MVWSLLLQMDYHHLLISQNPSVLERLQSVLIVHGTPINYMKLNISDGSWNDDGMSRLTVYHQIYRDQCIVVKQTRIVYYSEKFTACAHDIYKLAKQLLGDRGSTSLPQTGSPSELTEMFSSLFIDKIQNTRRDLQIYQMHGIDQDVNTSSINTPLERFI